MQRIHDEAAQSSREARLRGLLVQALSGDDDAYRTFLGDLAVLLRGYFRRRVFGRPDDVEDLLQECLLAVHNQRHTYDRRQPCTAWVYAIARYKLVDSLRRRGNREVLTDSFDDEIDLLSSAAHDASDARHDLNALLRELPDRQRLPIEWVKIHGLSILEAAQKLGMTESAVKVGIHRGLAALAARFGPAP